MAYGVLFDLDGTLVDTNYRHVVAWAEAFRRHGYDVKMSRLHALIGQGSDVLVESVIGRRDERISDAHTDFYAKWLQEVPVFGGAAALLRRCKQEGFTVVLATSASRHEADHLRAALGADDAVDRLLTKDDVDSPKPSPDIVETALREVGLRPADCVFVGDSVWDVQAAGRAGVPCLCVLSGGICAADLMAAGAVGVYADVDALGRDFAASALGELASRARG